MANFWPVPLNSAQEKKKKSRISLPQIRLIFVTDSQPLRFTLSLLSLRTSLGSTPGPLLLTHSFCSPCSIPAGHRTQLLSSSHATTHGRPSCFCCRACWEIRYLIQNGVPTQTNPENITSLEVPQISGISTTLRDGNWPTTHNAALFLIRSDSRLSCWLVLSTTAHFHLEH